MLIFANDLIMDDGLNHLAVNGNTQVICEGMPADYADANTLKSGGGVQLGTAAPTFTGPADATSGRKVTVDANDVTVDETGILDYVAIIDTVNSTLLSAFPLAHAAIVAVDTTGEVISLDGDVSGSVGVDDDVTVVESTGNDGQYTVASVNVTADPYTELTMNENVGDATVDGYGIYGAVKVTSGGGSASLDAYDHQIKDIVVA